MPLRAVVTVAVTPSARQRLVGIGASTVESRAMTSCAKAARAGGVERVDSRVYQVSAAVEDALAGSYQ